MAHCIFYNFKNIQKKLEKDNFMLQIKIYLNGCKGIQISNIKQKHMALNIFVRDINNNIQNGFLIQLI